MGLKAVHGKVADTTLLGELKVKPKKSKKSGDGDHCAIAAPVKFMMVSRI